MFAALSSAALSLIACSSSSGLAEEDIATSQQAVSTYNGLSPNGLSPNGLSPNGLSPNGLSPNGLTSNTLLMQQLNQATAREFLTYVVGCALPAGENITIMINSTPVTFVGELGLAPEWGGDNGSCDATCKAWVSGCLMARVNKLGEHVNLSLRGSTAALATTLAERNSYTQREATYYGDVFADPQVLYACTEHSSTLIGRVCGYVDGVPDLANCAMNVVGDCQDFCASPSLIDGAFSNCKNPDKTVPYLGSVTVYRQPPAP